MSIGESQRLVNESFMTTIRQLQDQLAEAKAVLRGIEWTGTDNCGEGYWCHVCNHEQHEGHAPDCRLAKILEAR